jgi:parvulin-like peptidyl-prolyl isomerase
MPKETRKKIVTKKHLARVERERRQARYILFGSLFVILLTVGLVGYGILDRSVLAPLRPVAVVNGERISLKELQTRVRYMRQTTVQRAEQTYQILQMFGQDPQFQQFYLSNLQQLQQQLQPTVMGQQVLDGLIDEVLLRQEAKRRNITASKEEVDELFQEFYGYYANGTPTPSPTFEQKPTSTLNPTQHALLSPTPTATATATPTATITATLSVTATPTLVPEGTLTPTLEVTATTAITATPVVTQTATPEPPTPTPTEYTLESFQQQYEENVKGLEENIQFTEANYRELAELQILSEKVRDAVLADLKPEQDHVWVRLIQTSSQESAQSALDRLNQGEDFGALASELSEDSLSKSSAGDIGWLNRYDLEDRYGAAFATTALEELEIGEVSQVVEGEPAVEGQAGTFYLVQVLGHEVRVLSPEEFDQLRQQEFDDWLVEQREASEVETNDSWMENVPTQPDLPPEIQQVLLNAQTPIQQ